MMHWISSLAVVVLVFFSLFSQGCLNDNRSRRIDLVLEECGLESSHGRHNQQELNIEAYYDPIQEVYEIGDTLWFTYIARDSAYDENFDQYFYIPDFPYQSKISVIASDRPRDVINMEIMFSMPVYIDPAAEPRPSPQAFEADGYWHFPYRESADKNYRITRGYMVLPFRGFYLVRSNDFINFTSRFDSPDNPVWSYDWECKVSNDYISIYTRTQHEDNLELYRDEIEYIIDEKWPFGFRSATTFEDGLPIVLRREAAYAFEVR